MGERSVAVGEGSGCHIAGNADLRGPKPARVQRHSILMLRTRRQSVHIWNPTPCDIFDTRRHPRPNRLWYSWPTCRCACLCMWFTSRAPVTLCQVRHPETRRSLALGRGERVPKRRQVCFCQAQALYGLRCNVSCGVRTHAQLPALDLKSNPLTTRAN